MTGPAPKLEIAPVDLAAWRDLGAVPYVVERESDAPGPDALVLALVHGNEIAGAIALDRLLRAGLKPARGRLTIAFANVDAYARFDPEEPHATRALDQDMNRLWSPGRLDGEDAGAELDRARQLQPLIARADLLLDLHSMQGEGPPLTLAGAGPRGLAMARAVAATPWVVRDAGHQAGQRIIDMPRFVDADSTAAAILVECGQHWRRRTVAVAERAVLRFLAVAGMLDAASPAQPPPSAISVLEVTDRMTVTQERFAFTRHFGALDFIPRAGTEIATDGAQRIVTPYDDCALVMPAERATIGQTAVRLARIVG